MKPFRTIRVGPASRIDTRSFSPQIGPTFGHAHEPPENPWTPPWAETTGEPNTLPVGGIIPVDRITSGRYWPGIGQTNLSPPDPTIAVGPNHVIETVNSVLAFYNKAGALQFSQDAGTFFSSVKQTTFQFDPRVVYDRIAQRWIILFDEESDTTQISKILLAVSDDSDPNGTWFRYSIEAKLTIGSNSYWLDYPGFSYGKDGFVISGNMFGFTSGGAGVQFIVLPKAPMLLGSAVTASVLRDGTAGSAQIADVFDTAFNQIYAICRLNSTTQRVYAIGNSGGAPVLNFTNITVPSAPAPTTPAPSSPGSLDTLDGRDFSASWRNGHIFAAHNIGVSGVNQVRWYDINLNNYPTGTPTLVQSGNIAPPAGPHFHMGAVASNGYQDVSVTFTRSASTGTGKPADAMAVGRHSTDPSGTMGTPFQLATSLGTTYGSAGTNRWGDYFQCVVDPTDDATFWGVAMVADASGGWQTVINSWTVTAPASLAANTLPATIPGAAASTGTVTLSGPAPQYGYVVSLSSSNPGVATVPATVTVPGGATSANYTVTTAAVAADTPISITANLRGTAKIASSTVLSPRLQGTVTLGDYAGSVAGVQATVEVRNVGSTVALDTYTVTLDAAGNFSVTTSRAGTFDVAVKSSHWLRKVVSNVTFNGSGATANVTLTNGDVNGDNAVTLGDFAAQRAAFGSTPSDPNWNPNADLNGDGAVGLGDFAILRGHFGLTGDN